MGTAISILFVASGLVQLAGLQSMRRAYARWGYPEWFRIAIGVVEIEAGVLAAFDSTRRAAALQLMPIMAGSIYTHAKTPGERHMALVPAFTLVALRHMAQSQD